VVCADFGDDFETFCVITSRGVAGGDGKSIAKCTANEQVKKKKKTKLTDMPNKRVKKKENGTNNASQLHA
jgi:hypothetical protein